MVKAGPSPGQFTLFRIFTGLFLTVSFWQKTDNFQAARRMGRGILGGFAADPVPADWLLLATLFAGVGIGLSGLLILGWRRRLMAGGLFLVWGVFLDSRMLFGFWEDVVVWGLLLVLLVVPPGEPLCWRRTVACSVDWRVPRWVVIGVWASLGLVYFVASARLILFLGWEAVWVNESRHLGRTWTDTLDSDQWSAWLWLPVLLLRAPIMWLILLARLLFLPTSLFATGRRWAWWVMVGLSIAGWLVFLPSAPLYPGLLLALLLIFDPTWLKGDQVSLKIGHEPLLLYDGECGLCNAIVRFLLREDVSGRIRFAELQSPLGQETLQRLGRPTSDFDSMTFLPDRSESGHCIRSSGVVAVLKAAGGIWRGWGMFLRWVPGPLRDAGYDVVAKLRYAVFGPYVPRPLERPEWNDRVLR